MKNWETTAAGILTIVGGLCTAGLAALHGQTALAISALTTSVPTGIGLIRAADGKSVPGN